MPPHYPPQGSVNEPPSLLEALSALYESLSSQIPNVNVLPVICTTITLLVALRWLSPEKFALVFYYFTVVVLSPIFAVLDVTLIPVLRFVRRRMKEERVYPAEPVPPPKPSSSTPAGSI